MTIELFFFCKIAIFFGSPTKYSISYIHMIWKHIDTPKVFYTYERLIVF